MEKNRYQFLPVRRSAGVRGISHSMTASTAFISCGTRVLTAQIVSCPG